MMISQAGRNVSVRAIALSCCLLRASIQVSEHQLYNKLTKNAVCHCSRKSWAQQRGAAGPGSEQGSPSKAAATK